MIGVPAILLFPNLPAFLLASPVLAGLDGYVFGEGGWVGDVGVRAGNVPTHGERGEKYGRFGVCNWNLVRFGIGGC